MIYVRVERLLAVQLWSGLKNPGHNFGLDFGLQRYLMFHFWRITKV